MSKPLIFLAFSNERDDYLTTLDRERKNIKRSLKPHEDWDRIQIETESSSSIEDIFEIINRYDNRISIFHYGGHANDAVLRLTDEEGNTQEAFGQGLAKLLGQQSSLKLVFLNGCATHGHVEQLLEQGVKAVIATSCGIDDKMATEFAEQFYHALSSFMSIDRAFASARAFIETKYRSSKGIVLTRGFKREIQSSPALNWGLYVQEESTEEIFWRLPKENKEKLILRNRFDYESRMDVNDMLIEILCEDLAKYNKDLDYELNKDEFDIPSIKREIVDSFPTPIGEQLRKLFTRSNNPNRPDQMETYSHARLQQLILTYKTSIQFVCFTLLSQLWDEVFYKDGLKIGEDYIVDFNSFFNLRSHNFESFDYIKLIQTIIEIFDKNKIDFFIDEIKSLTIDSNVDAELFDAIGYLNRLYLNALPEQLSTDELEKYCKEAEGNLAIILRSIAFMVKYKLVTIKNIEIIKQRHESPRYQHNHITLNRALTVANTGIDEVVVEFDNFADSKAVIFMKIADNQISEYLNLTPFIIDENAINGKYSSKLYLYAFEGENIYHYQFLNNFKDDPLEVSSENYAFVKYQFDRFRVEIFGEEYMPIQSTKSKTGASRFLRRRK